MAAMLHDLSAMQILHCNRAPESVVFRIFCRSAYIARRAIFRRSSRANSLGQSMTSVNYDVRASEHCASLAAAAAAVNKKSGSRERPNFLWFLFLLFLLQIHRSYRTAETFKKKETHGHSALKFRIGRSLQKH